jgi:hypothetical protein
MVAFVKKEGIATKWSRPWSLVPVRLRGTAAVTADPPAAASAADEYDVDAAFMQLLRHG